MKKKLFSFLFFCLPLYVQANGCFLYVTQDEYIDFNIYDPSIGHGPQHKQPVEMPSVSLDDHTLYFDTPCDGCTLNIVDENDVVVYTLVIPTDTTSLVLPSILSGDYTIQIIRGNYLFYGTIDLP